MDSLQVCQLIIVGIYTGAEEEASISPVDNLARAAEFDEIGLVFLIARCDETVDFAFEFDLLVVGVGRVPFGKARLASEVSLADISTGPRSHILPILNKDERQYHIDDVLCLWP